MERSYTVRELDDLRQAIETKWLFGRYRLVERGDCTSYQSRNYNETDKIKSVEKLVRTHMLAGHTAADLYASEQKEQA